MTEGKWPDAWKLHYVPYEMVAARANEDSGRTDIARVDITDVLKGVELKRRVHTVQAVGAKPRSTHMALRACCPEEPPRPRRPRRRNRWPVSTAVDVGAAGPELANEVREPYQPAGHECFANGRLSDSPSRPPRLARLDFLLNQGPLRAYFARGARPRAILASGNVRGPVRGRLDRCARPWEPLGRTWALRACPRGDH